MQRTISQNRRLYTLFGKLKVDKETKEDLVSQYTSGRTLSSAEMTIPECQALINNLQHMANETVKVMVTPKAPTAQNPSDKMRKKILSICHEMNWKEKGHLDWTRINGWLLKYGYLKKPLNDYKALELPTLITQFEQLLKDYYAKR